MTSCQMLFIKGIDVKLRFSAGQHIFKKLQMLVKDFLFVFFDNSTVMKSNHIVMRAYFFGCIPHIWFVCCNISQFVILIIQAHEFIIITVCIQQLFGFFQTFTHFLQMCFGKIARNLLINRGFNTGAYEQPLSHIIQTD